MGRLRVHGLLVEVTVAGKLLVSIPVELRRQTPAAWEAWPVKRFTVYGTGPTDRRPGIDRRDPPAGEWWFWYPM